MAPRTVLLARHGSHDEIGVILSGRSDIGVNAAGRAEVARLAARLASMPLVAVHSSPRARALQTAAIIAERHDLPVGIVDALDEINFGDWTGRRFDALQDDAEWNRWNGTRGSACPPGGEAMASAADRATRHVSTVADGTLCVSHCDIIRGVVARCLGLGLDRLLAFDIDPASVTRLALDANGSRVVALNERCA